MQSRRGVLKAVLGLWLPPVLCLPVLCRAAPPAGGGFHLVDGWILTDRDVAALAALRARG